MSGERTACPERSRMGVSRAGEGVLAFAHFPLQLSRTSCDPSTIEDCFDGTPKPTRETPALPIYDKARAVALPPTGSSGGPQRELCRFSELKLVTLPAVFVRFRRVFVGLCLAGLTLPFGSIQGQVSEAS